MRVRTVARPGYPRTTAFKELREKVLLWDGSQQKWSNSVIPTNDISGPMDLDRVDTSGQWRPGGKKTRASLVGKLVIQRGKEGQIRFATIVAGTVIMCVAVRAASNVRNVLGDAQQQVQPP